MKKYMRGPKIKSIDFMMKQEFVFINWKLQSMGWAQNYQARTLRIWIDRGYVYQAIKVIPDDGEIERLRMENAELRTEKLGFIHHMAKASKFVEGTHGRK